MDWITCGLLWCFYQLFGLSFWRHPFTAEHPLLSNSSHIFSCWNICKLCVIRCLSVIMNVCICVTKKEKCLCSSHTFNPVVFSACVCFAGLCCVVQPQVTVRIWQRLEEQKLRHKWTRGCLYYFHRQWNE